MHLTRSHLLFKLFFQEIDLKLQLLLVLLAFRLLLCTQICLLLKLLLIFALDSPDLLFLGSDHFTHGLLIFLCGFRILLSLLHCVLRDHDLRFGVLDLVLQVHALLLPF